MKIWTVLSYVQILFPWKSGKNATTASEDIVQTRKCHATASAIGIHMKNNMSPSPEVRVHKYWLDIPFIKG